MFSMGFCFRPRVSLPCTYYNSWGSRPDVYNMSSSAWGHSHLLATSVECRVVPLSFALPIMRASCVFSWGVLLSVLYTLLVSPCSLLCFVELSLVGSLDVSLAGARSGFLLWRRCTRHGLPVSDLQLLQIQSVVTTSSLPSRSAYGCENNTKITMPILIFKVGFLIN